MIKLKLENHGFLKKARQTYVSYKNICFLETRKHLAYTLMIPGKLISLILLLFVLGILNCSRSNSRVCMALKSPNYIIIRGKKSLKEIFGDFAKFFREAPQETKKLLSPVTQEILNQTQNKLSTNNPRVMKEMLKKAIKDKANDDT